MVVLTCTVSLPVAPCGILSRFERYWASYKKWKVREGEEIEGRKPSWFTGKTHHTLSAIKSSHALRSVQELASNRPDASSDRQTDPKNHSLAEHWRKSHNISAFLLCHIPELTSHDTNRLSHNLVLRLQADDPNIFRHWFLLFRVVPLSLLQFQGVLCSSSDIEKKKSTYVRYLSQCHFDQFLTVTWPRKSESMTDGVMVGQVGNMAEEKRWNVVAFSPVFGEVNGFLVGLPIRRSIWPIAGEFLDRSKSVAWFYGWKCVVCFSREPRWLPTF